MGKSKDISLQPKAAAHKKPRQTESNHTNLDVEKRRGVPQPTTSKNMKPQSSQKMGETAAAADPAKAAPLQKASSTHINPSASQAISNRTSAEPPVIIKSTGVARRKQKAPLLREIQRLGNSSELQIPRANFYRLVQEILQGIGAGRGSPLRMTSESLEVLRESSEIFLPQVFSDAYRITLNRGKTTLLPRDIQLLMFLRGPNGVGGN